MKETAIFSVGRHENPTKAQNVIEKFLCFVVVLLMCSVNVHAKRLVGLLLRADKMDKVAIRYRTDISKEVQKRIKKWDQPAILHGDYIENQNGKSLSLNGEELDFGIDYVGLKPIWYHLFEITTPSGKKGIARPKTPTSGEIYVPVKYDKIDNCGHDGFFLGHYTEGATEKVDVITLWGQSIATITNPYDFKCQYFPQYNQFLISTKKMDDPFRSVFLISYPDGEKPVNAFTAENVELHGNYIMVTDSGRTKRYTDDKYGTVEHKSGGLSDLSGREKLAFDYFFKNKWIEQAVYYFKDKKQYDRALDCFDYFERYDAPRVDYRNTYAGAMYVRLRIMAYHNAHRYAELQSYVRGQNELYSPSKFGLYYNPQTDSFYDMTRYIPEDDNKRADAVKYLAECNDLYKRSYDNVRRQQQEQAQTAQFVTGIFSNAINNISNGLSGGSSSSGSSTSSYQGSAAPSSASYSSGSSSSSSSSSSGSSSPTRHTCSRCNGTGKIVVENSHNGGYGLEKRMKTCGECGKTYDSSAMGHRHDRCNSCHGQGYYEVK